MAKGTESKNIIFTKLKEVYPESFWEDEGKILRIPINENGTRVEIKVTLTAAKTNLKEDTLTSAFSDDGPIVPISKNTETSTSSNDIEPTEEEKANIDRLINILGL